jgi:hypothetical protein
MTLFDWLNEITVNKRKWSEFNEQDKDEFNPYMINRFLSMNKDYIELVNFVQNIPYTEKEKYYNIYRDLIPTRKVWLKYVKSKIKGPNTELVSIIADHFQVSQKEAKEYIEILGKDNIKLILNLRGIDDKEIKKLLK